jgi:rRNA processing protein Krr1/Pno1
MLRVCAHVGAVEAAKAATSVVAGRDFIKAVGITVSLPLSFVLLAATAASFEA